MPDSLCCPCQNAMDGLRWLLARAVRVLLARGRGMAVQSSREGPHQMPRVLFAVSGKDYWTLADGTRHPCGYCPDELATPHEVFTHSGWDITIATPGSVVPTADEA